MSAPGLNGSLIWGRCLNSEKCLIWAPLHCVLQLTTAVTSAFLLAKVILSKVWPSPFPVPLSSALMKPHFPVWADGDCLPSPGHICSSSFSPKGRLAMCYPSFHSSSPGSRHGSWISKCYLKKQKKKTVSFCESQTPETSWVPSSKGEMWLLDVRGAASG